MATSSSTVQHFAIALCLAGVSASAYPAPTIDAITQAVDGQTAYRIPVLSENSDAARNMNTFIQATLLQALPDRLPDPPFSRVAPPEEERPVLSSIDFTVAHQGPGYFTIDVVYETVTSYPSVHEASYVFDAAIGQPIVLSQLLTRAGLDAVAQSTAQTRQQRISRFLRGESVPTGNGTDMARLATDSEGRQTQRELYTECRVYKQADSVRYDRLQLLADTLVLRTEACAPHAIAALDDLDDMPVILRHADIADFLSLYGRCLLIDKRQDCSWPRSLDAGGVYRGNINARYPITLVLDPYRGSWREGIYFYDKHALPIELRAGDRTRNRARLIEDSSPPAAFDLTLDAQGRLQGTWQQRGKRAMPVMLQ